MTEKYLSINLEDENSSKIAEVLANKTSKKILSLIAENDKGISQGDIALRLKINMNTLDYNIKKLLDSGLIEEAKDFFWSVKGKRIKTYKLANKRIIISTKPRMLGFVLSGLIFGALGFSAKVFSNITNNISRLSEYRLQDQSYNNFPPQETFISSSQAIQKSVGDIVSYSPFHGVLIWIIAGVLIGIVGYFLYRLFSRLHFEKIKASAKMRTLVKGGTD